MSKRLNQSLKPKAKKQNRLKKVKAKSSEGGLNNFVTKYINPVKRYVIVALFLAVIVRIAITIKSGALIAMTQVGGYDWLISVIMAAMYGALEYKHHRKAKLSAVIGHSIVMGVLFGLVIAIVDWAVVRDMWSFLNIIKKPIIISLVFGAVGTIGFMFHKNGN